MSITSIVNDLVTSVSVVNALKPLPPTISGYSVAGKDDLALDPAGGQTVQINGTGFLPGATITFDGSAIAVVTYVNPNQLTFTSPAKTAGTYTIYAVNPDGGTAIYVPGIIYSTLPTWTTAAGSLGSYYETTSISNTVVAAGDAPVTYSLYSGSLPTGSTLAANGVITGTAPVDSSSTTYSFTIQATDAQLQDSTRSFSLTINVDAVTWVSPANATTYTSAVDSAIANVTLSATDAAGYAVSYSANALPTGLSLSGANITGTPTVIADSSTLLTATAATTNRTATRTINWSITVANDAYFEYNTLLIPGASTTFVDDASTNNFAITINGDTKPNNFNPYTPGYYSNFFQAGAGYTSGNGLSVAANSAFAFGTGDFTVEFWTRPPAFGDGNSTAPTMVAVHNGATDSGWQLYWNSLAIGIRTYYSNVVYWNADMTPYLNQWSHIAYVRYNGTQKIYVNGVEKCSTAAVWNWTDNIVGIAQTAQYYTGNISNLRMIKGTALYTSNFTPPTSPLTAVSGTSLLTCQSNRFIDNSTNNFTITLVNSPTISSAQPFTPNSSYSSYGSGYFDGTGDYLSTPQNAAFNFGTGDFTVEGWWNFNSFVSDQALIILGGGANGGGPFTGWWLRYQPSIGLGFSRYDGSTFTEYNFALSSALVVGAWYHIACTRSGTSLKMFVNGVAQGTTVTTSISFNNINSDPLQIGKQTTGAGVSYTNAYVTDVRLVKGTAVYTTTFTPPSAPLTAIANTSLLVLQNNQSVNNSVFLDNSSNNFLVTRAGNTTQGTFSPYGGNWSNYFGSANGNSLYLSAQVSGTGGVALSGNYTIEMWLYPTAASGSGYSMLVATNTNGGVIQFYYNSSGALGYYSPVAGQLTTSSSPLTFNAWQHVALVRSSNVVKVYVNGVEKPFSSIITDSSTVYANYIGGLGTVYNTFGYISNLRVLNGTALYTTTFTPPTTPLTPITNTALLTCQSNRLIDNSINNYTINQAGSVSTQRVSPFNPSSVTPTSYSGYFDGTGDYLTVPFNSAFNLGSGNFTIEFWVNTTSTAAYATALRLGDTWTTGSWALYLNDSGGSGIPSWWSQTLSQTLSTSGATINDGAWHHIALVRNGTTMTMYIDGTSRGTLAVSTNTVGDTSTSLWIARDASNVRELAGYLSNIRIVKGTALYTTSFTPSTTPLTTTSQGATASQVSLLTLQSTTFIDNSTNNFTISAFGNSQPTIQNPFGFTSATTNGYTVSTIGGSGYFDGTGDYLNVPANAVFAPTGDFSIMFWCYVSPTASGYIHPMGNYTSNVTSDWMFEINMPGGTLYVYNSGGATQVNSSGTIKAGQWTHLAMIRSGTTVTAYLNGVNIGTRTQSGTFGSASKVITIGGTGSAGDFLGYISDVTFVSGTALYTSNFVPPSAPLTAVQNTVLLNNMTNAGIYDAAMMNDIESVGDAKLSTAVSKFGGSSMSFDGTGDRLSTSPGVINSLGSGDFTIEGWVYPLSLSSMRILSQGTYAAGEFLFILNSNGSADFCEATTSRLAFSAGSFVVGEWKYFAIVRSGSGSNNLKGYINGTLAGTGTSSSYNFSATTAIFVGSNPTTASQDFQGYIDDLRITRGYARYTANFTAPTTAFQLF